MARRDLAEEIRSIVERQAAAGGDGGATLSRQELELEKWRLIHEHPHRHPFPTPARLVRSAQWREAANRVRDLGEVELLDWALQQAEIARNLERGVRDLRPRKNGPCHGLLLEYAANRKRKALAVLHFAKAGVDEGVHRVDSDFHARTKDILSEGAAEDDGASGGHEGVPWTRPKD